MFQKFVSQVDTAVHSQLQCAADCCTVLQCVHVGRLISPASSTAYLSDFFGSVSFRRNLSFLSLFVHMTGMVVLSQFAAGEII